MRRVLALLLVCMFMLSHGSMGAAAPHADHHDVHSHDVHGETVSVDDMHPSSTNPEEPGSDAGHVTHVHVVVALPNPHAFEGAASVAASVTVRPLVTAELASRGVAPLLEPPAA
jgi:hypothetical protein